MSLCVKIHPGQLPKFWDRSAIFVANLQSLFFGNQGGRQALQSQIKGVQSYGGRLVPIIDLLLGGRENVLLVESAPDPHLLDYLTDELGMTLPTLEIMPLQTSQIRRLDADDAFLQRLRGHRAEWMDGFVTDGVLLELAGKAGKRVISQPDGSRRGNNKLMLHQHLLECGFPTFETELAKSKEQVATSASKLSARGYRRIVAKAQIGASGVGMLVLEAAQAGDSSVPDYFFHEGACLMQGWLEDGVGGAAILGSPSVQIFVDEDTVSLFDITEQILSAESVHNGNHAPVPYLSRRAGLEDTLLDQASAAGRWLHAQGYRGTASADFLLVTKNTFHSGSARVGSGGSHDRVEVIMCELNARVTGATYPAVLARHFMPGGAWLMRNLRFKPPLSSNALLSALREDCSLWLPGNEKGVLPINFNLNRDGGVDKGQFLCLARKAEDCSELLGRIERQLPLKWHYDRD